jgi:hypothetical protein
MRLTKGCNAREMIMLQKKSGPILGFIAGALLFPWLAPAQTDVPARKSNARPQRSVQGTIEQAIKALEAYDCAAVAIDFLNPIKRAQIKDLEAYRAQRQCSPEDKGNLDEVLLALKLARQGEPEYKGITATISLQGVGLRIQEISLMKYLDGRWYFNEL